MTQRFYVQPPIKCHLKERKKGKQERKLEAGGPGEKERKQYKTKGEQNQQTGATENSKQELEKKENQAYSQQEKKQRKKRKNEGEKRHVKEWEK